MHGCHRVEYDYIFTVVVTRIEYDAYRTDLELLQTGPRDLSSANKIEDSKRRFNTHREKFERLRSDVGVKLRFLDENKVRSHHLCVSNSPFLFEIEVSLFVCFPFCFLL